MTQFIEGDPIRILTLAACVVAVYLSIDGLLKRRGYPAPLVFMLTWSAHTALFYAAYYLTGRWSVPAEVRAMVAYWPPVIWFQAAASVAILLTSQKLTGGGNGK